MKTANLELGTKEEDTQGREKEETPRKKLKLDINQIGRGDQSPFVVQRPLNVNNFVLEVKQSKSFRQASAAEEITYTAVLSQPSDEVFLSDLSVDLEALFSTILNESERKYGKSGVIRVFIQHPNLQKAIIVPPTYLGMLTPQLIMEHIENVLYSSGDIPADEMLEINVAVVELLKGSSRRRLVNLDEDITKKRSLVKIVNEDNSCLPRAIIVGYKKLLCDENPQNQSFQKEYKKISDSRRKPQKIESTKLREAVGIPADREGLITDIIKYEDYLKVDIVVISARMGNQKVYNGSSKYGTRKIFLYHSEPYMGKGHFDTITKINAMMCTQYYCNTCNKAFKERNKHRCRVWCDICGRSQCVKTQEIFCSDCNKTCRSADCFQTHKSQKKSLRGINKDKTIESMCGQFWQCLECEMKIKRQNRDPSLHECGETVCKVCHEYFLDSEEHFCYMRGIYSEVEPDKFIFYDFECTQETGKHVPNLVISHSICSQCEHEEINSESKCSNCGSRCNECKKFNKQEQEYERNPCVGCGKRQIEFAGENCQKDFCQWLIDEQHKKFTVIAHNARAYDAYFIYEYLMNNSITPDPVIFNGTKIMYMNVGRGLNIRIIDSLNFLPMSLAALPKSFGLTELKKGYFPHLYNTPEHWNEILPEHPPIQYYDPDSMLPEKKKEFEKWYEDHKHLPFDFQKEIREYCISDVDILLKSCWKFRELLKEETGQVVHELDVEDFIVKKFFKKAVDPFSYLTIASVCLGVFRSKFLKETWSILLAENAVASCKHSYSCKCTWIEGRKMNAYSELEIFHENEWKPKSECNIVKSKFIKSAIGLIPTHGYSGRDNHSKESIEWLYSLQNQWKNDGKDITIQHARNGGEKTIVCPGRSKNIRYKVDGYFEYAGMKYVCEYNGCNFHGCINCFPANREQINNQGKSLAQRFRETTLKKKRLSSRGYIVLDKWSCKFNQEKKQEPLKGFIQSLNIQCPINVRECYFGGRTNALVLHKKFEQGEKGYYVDFTSLYPDILKYKKFPVGHPTRIIQDFENVQTLKCLGNCAYTSCNGYHKSLPYFGLIKATFRPPKNLLHPVLPMKCNKKLKFPLCHKCATENSQEKCVCSDKERSFTHTYCTPEIEVALNEGYEIVKIHEVLHWKDFEMYDSVNKKGGLFTEYINTFLKLKQQSSGYPENVCTEEEKNEYIDSYLKHEGILMDKESIKKNPGLRSLSKLALNSFYGKFGQRTNMKKTKFVSDVADFYNIWTDESKVLTDFHIMNSNVIQIEYQNKEEFEPVPGTTNVVIAAFCTSWARLKLWSVMNKLQERVVYHDTDSIIFSVKNTDNYIPPLGKYLGDLTNELTCKEIGCKNFDCQGHWIEEFVSCGPKNYTYRLNTGEVVCKVRGFSLNHKSSLIINFESMKKSLYSWMNNEPHSLITVKTEVRRSKTESVVYNTIVSKKYSVVYDKRRVLPDFTTKPYGYTV